MEELWSNGVIYGVCQEDMIGSLPGTARVVIFPNEDAIRAETETNLEKLRMRSIKVFTGGDSLWKNELDVKRVEYRFAGENHLLTRDVKEGRLYFFNNLKKKTGKFALSVFGMSIDMEVKSTGLVLENKNKIVMAENNGRLVINGRMVADSGGKKYAIKSMDGQNLEDTGRMLLLPYEPMTIMIDKRFKKAEVTDAKGRILDSIFLDIGEYANFLDINRDMVNFRLLIS